MDHRPLLRSQPEPETALSRKRSGTHCSPPLARNGDSGGQRRGRLRGIEREQLHGHVCVFAMTERLVEAKGGGWSVSCKPCEKRSFSARLRPSRRCLESVTQFSCCCLYCHDDDGVQQHVFFLVFFSLKTCMSKCLLERLMGPALEQRSVGSWPGAYTKHTCFASLMSRWQDASVVAHSAGHLGPTVSIPELSLYIARCTRTYPHARAAPSYLI
jgi:hypothetical protein